jgi:hypothetical protein
MLAQPAQSHATTAAARGPRPRSAAPAPTELAARDGRPRRETADDALGSILRGAVAGRAARGPELQRSIRVVDDPREPDGVQIAGYVALRDFLAARTGLVLRDAGELARLLDLDRIGLSLGPADAAVVEAAQRLRATLDPDVAFTFTSAHALAFTIVREFRPLVASVPGIRLVEGGGGMFLAHPQQPGSFVKLASYPALAELLRSQCGVELVAADLLDAAMRAPTLSAGDALVVNEARELLAALHSTTASMLVADPAALAFYVLARHPTLVVAAPSFVSATRVPPPQDDPMSRVNAMLPLISDLVTETTETKLPPFEWMLAMSQTPAEVRKELGAALFATWFHGSGPDIAGDLVVRKLNGIRTVCGLTSAQIETDGQQVFAAFRASPAKYVPMAVTGKLSGVKTGAVPGTQTLEAVQCDGPLPSPAGEFIAQFNARFAGKVYDVGTGATIDALSTTQANQTTLSSIPKKHYRRAGKVMATITGSKPGTGRTGSGETEIGWFGRDEELLTTGKQTIPYEGGHLINMYEDWNLVPQAKSFNNPLYITAIENASVKALAAGAELLYKVTVKYPCDRYPVKPSDAALRGIASTTKMKDGTTFHAALAALLKLDPTLDAPDFAFTCRVPNYWNARVTDSKGTNVLEGKGRQDPRGPYSPTIDATTTYTPTGVEQFTYTLLVDATSLTMPVATGKKKTVVTYTSANKVKIKARQASFAV